jgi:hypothetical protein
MKTQGSDALRRDVIASAVGAAVLGFSGAALAAAAPPPNLNGSSDPTLKLYASRVAENWAPPGSAAANPDPRDFNGVWYIGGYQYMLGPELYVMPPLKPQYVRLLEERIRKKNEGKPETDAATQCFPHGMPRIMESPYPIEIVQTDQQITLLHEVAHNLRRLYINRPAPKDWPLSFLGYSNAHWEGDTLVVETTRINDRSFIDDEGSAKSTSLKTTERFRKVDGGRRIEMIMTIDDPVTLEKPYSYKRYYYWRPDIRPMEYVCEENNRNAPVDGVTVAK